MSILRNELFVGEALNWLFPLNAEQSWGNSCHHCHSVSNTNNNFFPLPEPFMSLLLVLSHMEFKLDMEVSANPLNMPLKTADVLSMQFWKATWNFPFGERLQLVFSKHFEIKQLYANNHVWSLHTELQFSGWELATTGKKTMIIVKQLTASQQYYHGFSSHGNWKIPGEISQGTLQRDNGIWTREDGLLIVCVCFQVCETYEVVPCREVGMVLRFVSSTLLSTFFPIKYIHS